MKRKFIIFYIFSLASLSIFSQGMPFITVWDLTIDSGQPGRIQFRIEMSGQPVNFEWYQISNPSVRGSGSYPTSGPVFADNLPSSQIRFLLFPQNLTRFSFATGAAERARLVRVEQWGDVQWGTLEEAFLDCANLQVTATDTPNLSGARNMRRMFAGCSNLNGPANINLWNVSQVNNFSEMFSGASNFNQPLGSWVVTGANNLGGMFGNASAFNQNLGGWLFGNGANLSGFFSGSGLDCINYSATLIGWESNPNVNSNLSINCDGLEYGTNAIAARNGLIDRGWSINGDTQVSYACFRTGDFITIWDMATPGSAASSINFNLVSVPTQTVNYRWELLDGTPGGSGTLSTGVATIPGLPTSHIRLFLEPNNLLGFSTNGNLDAPRLVDIEQWGYSRWISMENAFSGCSNLQVSASDNPDLSLVTNAAYMFGGCSLLTGPSNISTWNVSNLLNSRGMFAFARNFNQDIRNWNVSNVTDMSYMFNEAEAFNQGIGDWQVSSVTNMRNMFFGADDFNGNIGGWNVTNVVNMQEMFNGAGQFNQDLAGWTVSRVTDMRNMFGGASNFNQDIGSWNLNANVLMQNMLDWSGIDCFNYSQTLYGWAANPSPPVGRTLGAGGLRFNTYGFNARNLLGWTFIGDTRVFATINPASGSGPFRQTVCLGQPINEILLQWGGEAVGLMIVGNLPLGMVQGISGGSLSISGTPANHGLHTINLETIGGCDQANISIEIEVLNASSLAVISNNPIQNVCVGQTINPIDPIVYSFTGASHLILSPGAPSWVSINVDPSNQTAIVSGTPPGVADIYNFSVVTAGGCGSQQASISISVINSPTLQLVTPSDDNQVVCVNQNIRDIAYLFRNATSSDIEVNGLPSGVTYRTDASTITISGAPTQVASYVYTIQLNGCQTVSQSGTITVDRGCVVLVPEGFSPNNDGFNDTWVVNALNLFPHNHLRVFNREGTLVYEASPFSNHWDGRPNRGVTLVGSGTILPAGVYYFKLSLVPGESPINGYVFISY